MRPILCLFAAASIAGCSEQKDEQPTANQAQAPEKVPHCFFKDTETADWSVSVAGDQLVVKGRAYRSDARYKAVLLEPQVKGAVAVVRPSVSNNDTGFAADGNWWDVETSIPAAGVQTVEIRCGKKVLASLDLPDQAG